MRGISLHRLRVSSALINGLDSYTEDAGLNFESLASAVELNRYDPSDQENFVPLESFAKLLDVGAVMTGDEAFGLRFAISQMDPPSGPLGVAMMNAPTVKQSLLTMVKFLGVRLDLAHIELVLEQDSAAIEWSFSPLLVRRWQLCDFVIGALAGRIKQMIDPSWKPLRIGLSRPKPRNMDIYRQFLGRNIQFSHDFNFCAISASTLAEPLQDVDPVVYEIACNLLDRMGRERHRSGDLLTSAREEIILALPQVERLHISRIARRLGLSVRSLQRYLAEEHGTTFRNLVDETRKSLAKRYMQDPKLSLSQISYQLGFSAPSAFTRASYRWFGERPVQVRRALRQGVLTSG